MATTVTTNEIRKMQIDDLRKDIVEKQVTLAQMRVKVGMGSEKDTAQFLRAKRELARLLTILNEAQSKMAAEAPALKEKPKTRTMPHLRTAQKRGGFGGQAARSSSKKS